MGWSSWYAFGPDVTQDKMEASFRKLVNRTAKAGSNISLRDVGYSFANLDDGWQACHAGVDGSFHSATGEPLVDTKRFPDFSAMTSLAHDLGLKPGFYFNNYICGEGMPAGGIGGPVYNRNMRGSVDFLAKHRLEYVKVDSGSVYNDMDLWHALAAESGTDIVIENCHQGGIVPNASWCPFDLWRTTGDAQVVGFDIEVLATARLLKLSRLGCWAYADTISVLSTVEESRSQFGVFAIMSSPLVISFNILDDALLLPLWEVLTNREAIQVNQEWAGTPGTLVRKWSPHDVRDPLFAWVEPCNASEPLQHGWSFDAATAQVRWTQAPSAPPLCLGNGQGAPGGAFALAPCGGQAGSAGQRWRPLGGRLWEEEPAAEAALRAGRSGVLRAADCNASMPGQRWRLSAAPGSSQQCRVQNDLGFRDGGCWEITACETRGGAEVGVNFGCKPLPAPGWTEICDANGAWSFNQNGTITSVMDGQCLQVDPADNATVNVGACTGGALQKWVVDQELVKSVGLAGRCVDSGVLTPPPGTTGRCASLSGMAQGLASDNLPIVLASAADCNPSGEDPVPPEQHVSVSAGGALTVGASCAAVRRGVPTPFGPLQLWAKPMPLGAVAVLVLNRGPRDSRPAEVNVSRAELPGLAAGSRVAVRDLWAHADLPPLDAEGHLTVSVPGADSTFHLLSPQGGDQRQQVLI